MILSDAEIGRRVRADGLIENCEPANIVNCAYTLRVGSVIEPKEGVDLIAYQIAPDNSRSVSLKPNEVVIIRTIESVQLPEDLCASYTPLFALAQKGIMLLNASLVEPGYHGPLSCFLINFSSQSVPLAHGAEIAKVAFVKLDSAPQKLKPLFIKGDAYQHKLREAACRFDKSFLNVNRLGDHLTETVVKRAVAIFAILLFLIAFLPLVFNLSNHLSRSDQTVRELSNNTMLVEMRAEIERLRDQLERLDARSEASHINRIEPLPQAPEKESPR